ncbi:unnamed protein product (macronuclear) [Paramecium tetraurelia]|uniref:VLIG-type G domain-containing protein n=1 Tax=Paramecium tetraurelia TaxID=5888 RepID=A0BWF5_PARTE|nr:uncharacterized protein GSPATT00032724001 [Paramecium tetraurelia]CAK62872.1 unnamed protein product [Paramecium tetraurelia]|eukprot:XP_001430270.1 hypothetical protein (macronuclear) [Paramecium tetraurelia strain d4-2]
MINQTNQLAKLKQEKQKIKQKYPNSLEKQCQDNKEIKSKMSQLKQEMDNNRQNISRKTVGLQLFWRELIGLRKSKNYYLEIDPVLILYQLMRKGESLEFLDGDTLSIDTQFLLDLESKITQNKKQKILVISILGPQSSGKSTILNKIFGCHFWASVGRCTKGIDLQILQVQNEEQFQNHFDQILILDTEGLQNPNQNDPEFDKKIALFVLSISDIIIINVKGEINQQFKSLVEMCIFTLGHLKNGLSVFLSWFFNQNDNYKNVEPFRQQIKDVAQDLNIQWNENYQEQQVEHIDYAEILDIKDNIYGLGFASDQKGWQKKDWIQSVNNHTFSEEAYRQGINMIQQFIQKLQNQKDSLNNFSHFLQNVQRNWESIEKLPDLLEFSEIMQHQQNLVMKKHFDELWNNQDIRQVGVNLIQEAKLQLQSQQQIAFQNIRQIKQEQENKIEQTNQQIKTHLEEKMETFRSENKIQKKIMQKYLEKLKKLIEALEADCKLKLLNLIQEYEREYQQKKGYVQIDNFIQEVLNDQLKRKKFQGNDKEIESEFKKKWDEFISETERQSESQYLEMIKAQYKALQCISNQFILRTKNEQQYINYFRNEIIKQNPNNEQSKEQEQIFQLFKQEFSEAEQFIFINKKQNNLAYLDIFQQKIEEKLEKSKAQFLDMTQFYSQKSIYQVVAKQEIQNYLQNQFQNDFQNYFKKYEKQRNIKNYYYNFLSLLYYLQIKYDEELKQELDNIINNPTSWQQLKLLISSKSSQVSEAFSKLKKSLKFYDNDTLELDFSGKQFGQTFQDAYQSLKVIKIVDSPLNGVGSALDNSQKFRQQQFQKYIIIDTEIEIKPNQNQFQEDFNYIKSPKNDVPYNFRTTFPKQFNEIMIQQNGWRKLYNELYELIKQEIGYSKSTINKQAYQNNIEDENISSFNPYLITSIIQKVENNIKIKYNNQFAQYGVILTDVGERCIFYYCILIIWRFLCYQRWNLKNIQQKHQHNYYTELIRCKAEINQDNQKQSCIKATELVSKIQTLLKNQFLDRTKKEVVQQMNQVSMSNVELIAKLDKELLIGLNAKMFEDEQFKKKILSYTTDHKSFINLYILNILKQVQDQSLTEYSNKYRKELSLYLKSIKKNAKIFFEYIKNQQKEVKTIKYFVEDAKQKDKISYENYLFRLFIQCLLGKIEDKIDIIEDQYKEIFQLSNYHPVDNQFKINWQLFDPQDQQVYNLKSFVETLIQQIDLILDSIDQIRFKQTEYQLDIEFEKLKLQMNGCEYTCPCCNRKCDEDNDDVINHIHKCQNGHQIRGINGILISHNSPSLYTCEEILDECILRTLETNVQKTWKEVKKAHSNWNFKNINEAKNNENRVKWKNVWNIGLGKLICQHLKKSLNHEIIFSQKSDFQISISNIHYILILDDSGSMQGVNWDNAKNGALHCIKSLENVDCAKVSVIIFNGDARIVVECQKPNYIQMSSCISYKGGNTAFDPPFNLALQLIVKYKGFNKIQILFYTDGEAGYPQTTIDKFCQLPPQIRSLINLIACSGEKSSHSLQLMIQKFQQNMQQASLRNSVQPIEIQKVWTEVVSKNIHSQLV